MEARKHGLETSYLYILELPSHARSYAMRGKNRGKSGKRRVRPPCLASWINGTADGRVGSSLIPQQVGSEWALGRFAEDVEPAMLEKIFKCEFRWRRVTEGTGTD